MVPVILEVRRASGARTQICAAGGEAADPGRYARHGDSDHWHSPLNQRRIIVMALSSLTRSLSHHGWGRALRLHIGPAVWHCDGGTVGPAGSCPRCPGVAATSLSHWQRLGPQGANLTASEDGPAIRRD